MGQAGREIVKRLELRRAGTMEGLADEIALLRAQLKKAVNSSPEGKKAQKDLMVLTRGLETLLKVVSAQHRLSPKGAADLAENISRVLDSLGDQLLPPDR